MRNYPKISPTALTIFQQCLYDARTSGDFDRLMSLEPCCKITGAARNRAFAFESREALLVQVLFAPGLTPLERDDLGDGGVTVVYNNRTSCADMIQIARKAVAKFPDFGFFHGNPIIARLALAGHGA